MATPTRAAMLWISGLPTLRSWGTLRQATYPQLLHHALGHDPKGEQAARRETCTNSGLSQGDR